MDKQTVEQMIQIAAEYWAHGLPFVEGLQEQVFIAALRTKISEKLHDVERVKGRWNYYIVCDPHRKWVDQPLQDAAAAVGFDIAIDSTIFFLRQNATMIISNTGVQVSEGTSDEWRPLFSVE